MNATEFQDLLWSLRACTDAREWAKGKTSDEVIDTCHRGDWLLWLARQLDMDIRKMTLANGHCANTVRHLMKDVRSTNAVDAAIAFGEGRITTEELNAAATAAYAAAYAARNESRKLTADICRQYIGDELKKLIKEREGLK